MALEAVVLAVWWLWGAQGEDFRATWTLFSPYNVGSVVIQFALLLVVLLFLNKRLASAVEKRMPRVAGD